MIEDSIFSRIKFDRQTAASIVALLLIVFSGYLVYSYFTKVGAQQEGVIDLSQISDTSDVKINADELGSETGDITNGETAQTEQLAEEDRSDTSIQQECAENWVAIDYQEGDVQGDEYQVKCGDTLWEIAEGKYGDGSQWTKIRDANADKIGTLPNGTQALIVVGTNLTLP